MRSRDLVTTAALVTLSLLTACAGTEIPDVDTGLPSPPSAALPSAFRSAFPSGASRPMPPAVHKWRTDGLVCPTVTNPAARALGITGPGETIDMTDVSSVGDSIGCQWGPADGTAPSAVLHLSTSTSQAGGDARWQLLSATLPTPLDGVGEQAFISADTGSGEIRVAVRSGNANLDVRLIEKKDGPRAGALRKAAAPISIDLLGSLVPA